MTKVTITISTVCSGDEILQGEVKPNADGLLSLLATTHGVNAMSYGATNLGTCEDAVLDEAPNDDHKFTESIAEQYRIAETLERRMKLYKYGTQNYYAQLHATSSVTDTPLITVDRKKLCGKGWVVFVGGLIDFEDVVNACKALEVCTFAFGPDVPDKVVVEVYRSAHNKCDWTIMSTSQKSKDPDSLPLPDVFEVVY